MKKLSEMGSTRRACQVAIDAISTIFAVGCLGFWWLLTAEDASRRDLLNSESYWQLVDQLTQSMDLLDFMVIFGFVILILQFLLVVFCGQSRGNVLIKVVFLAVLVQRLCEKELDCLLVIHALLSTAFSLYSLVSSVRENPTPLHTEQQNIPAAPKHFPKYKLDGVPTVSLPGRIPTSVVGARLLVRPHSLPVGFKPDQVPSAVDIFRGAVNSAAESFHRISFKISPDQENVKGSDLNTVPEEPMDIDSQHSSPDQTTLSNRQGALTLVQPGISFGNYNELRDSTFGVQPARSRRRRSSIQRTIETLTSLLDGTLKRSGSSTTNTPEKSNQNPRIAPPEQSQPGRVMEGFTIQCFLRYLVCILLIYAVVLTVAEIALCIF